jgi:hypothetical protein
MTKKKRGRKECRAVLEFVETGGGYFIDSNRSVIEYSCFMTFAVTRNISVFYNPLTKSAVIFVPNVKVKMQTQLCISHECLHDLLWGSFTSLYYLHISRKKFQNFL